jgi:AraC family transcriptional activator of tynA and feaB
MTNSIVSISTAATTASLRPDYWAQALGTLCGQLRADPLGAATIDGHIDYATIGRLRICRIEVSRHRIIHATSWTRRGGTAVAKVLFQTSGTSIFEQDGRRILVTPGDGLAYDVSRPHVITSSALTRHDVVILPRQMVQRLMAGRYGAAPQPLLARHFSAREGVGRMAHDFILSAFEQAPALAPDCEAQVADALAELLLPLLSQEPDNRSGRAALIVRIKTMIEANLGDPGLSIDQLSAALQCSKRYLHMSFAEEGTTIAGYIWQQRLEKCQEELASRPASGKTLTDIAFSWGFSSSSHFTHLFKKRYGVAPSTAARRAAAALVLPVGQGGSFSTEETPASRALSPPQANRLSGDAPEA